MIRGTTPTHTFTLPFDTSNVQKIMLVYAQDGVEILSKAANDCQMSGDQIEVRLTQEETLKFDCKKPVQIQLKVLTNGGDVMATNIMTVGVGRCLSDEVLK